MKYDESKQNKMTAENILYANKYGNLNKSVKVKNTCF